MPLGRFVVLLLFVLAPLPSRGGDYLEELVRQATAKRLSQRVEWHNLLHYKRYAWRPGIRSLADDARFFNAPNGKHDPEAELIATLEAFFSDRAETDREQNPQCAFIARYQWLKQELHFDPARLPERECLRFNRWRAGLNPHAITLVFPSAYLNNPASAYGHTLLRVDAADQDDRTRLLAYAINYAAATDEDNGLIFAVRGLFGGYPGLFAIAPYYVKVSEYNDLENRDIWEYRLDFTPEEIDRLLMHVWELGPVRFDYYFFDENCSYHLLSLFEVARPTLRLTDRFRAWAIPADTVRAVVEEEGLVRDVTYRAARATVLREWQKRLPGEDVELARALAHGEATPGLDALAPEKQARTLELAYEYLEYERLAGARDGIESAQATGARLRELLLARSRLKTAPPEPVAIPSVRPDEGHGSARVDLGAGREDGRDFQEVRLRPAYHDLLDPEEGYVQGAQIEFFGTTLRRTEDDHRFRLERLDLLNITSLSPRDRLLKPLSWKVASGWVRKRFVDDDRELVFRLSGGAGVTHSPLDGMLVYALAEGAVDLADDLDDGYALGLGPGIGAVAQVGPADRVAVHARALRYGVGDDHDARDVGIRLAHAFGRRFALRLELEREREFDRAWNRAGVFVLAYF
ncbi:membrane protein [Sulfurifustis variabilis]|uniref:Membrane protein n=1 Tax=Sulfurifustis variabilis TaxID=1675686 RepID=A0A1B4V5G2_9GAMM|nr:DUF4105 domain-containing protein [Sulfurifustis variabilis]BAU48780.1 membrane protein [Sulfurifustis variabilis]